MLGRGAMGVVYKARQRGLKRVVALKMILADVHASEQDLARFRTEAEAVARFQHPNIVQIYDVGEQDGRPFFSLEFVDGESLAKKVFGTPLPPRAAAETVQLLAQAMQYAHDQGITHRDLKPANVLVTNDGRPKISDFGLAKRLDDDSGRTRAGSLLGTPSYMPPEQAEGRVADVGPLADVYSLGAILYELLTGRAPFRAATIVETLTQVCREEPVSPVQLQPGTPRDLETICLRCLQKDPKKRYASAAELGEDLRRYLAGEAIKARPVPPWEHAWRWCRRNPAVAALCAAVVLLTLAALAGSLAFSVVIYNEKTAKEQETIRANANFEAAKQHAAAKEQETIRANANFEAAQQHAAAKEQETIRANDNAKTARKNADDALNRQYAAVNHVLALGEEMQKDLRRKSANPQSEAELRPLREEMLKALRKHLLDLGREIENTGLTASGTVYAHQRLGDLFRDLGLGAEAIQQYQEATDLMDKAIADMPKEDRARANKALLLARLADMEIDLRGDVPGARQLYQKALNLQTDVEEHPGNRFYKPIDHKRLKANYLMGLGRAAVLAGDPATARTYFEQAVAYRGDWAREDGKNVRAKSWLAEAYLALGDVCARLGDDKARDAAFKEAVERTEQLSKLFPASWDFKADLAEVYLTYGDACFRRDKDEEAKQYYDKCPPLLTAALDKDPDSLRFQGLAVRLNYARGLAARQAHDPDAAKYFADALKLSEKLVAVNTESLPAQTALVLCLARAGKAADAVKKADALRPRLANDGLLRPGRRGRKGAGDRARRDHGRAQGRGLSENAPGPGAAGRQRRVQEDRGKAALNRQGAKSAKEDKECLFSLSSLALLAPWRFHFTPARRR